MSKAVIPLPVKHKMPHRYGADKPG
jgi:hypothetical protein